MQMRSKRVFAAFTSVCLAATLAACGGTTKTTTSTSTSSKFDHYLSGDIDKGRRAVGRRL